MVKICMRDVRVREKFPTLGKPPVLTRSGLTYGFFFEMFDFATSSTLVTSVVGVVALAAVVVSVSAVVVSMSAVVVSVSAVVSAVSAVVSAVSAVVSAVGCVAGWEMEDDARDGDED